MREKSKLRRKSKQGGWTLVDLLIVVALFIPAVAVLEEVKAAGGGVLPYLVGLPLALVLGGLLVLIEWRLEWFLWRRSQKYGDRTQNIVAIGLLALCLAWIVLACICGDGLAHLVIKFSVQRKSARVYESTPGPSSSLPDVPNPCSNTPGCPARVAGLRAELALPSAHNPAANAPCAPPGGFSANSRHIPARATFGRRFGSPPSTPSLLHQKLKEEILRNLVLSNNTPKIEGLLDHIDQCQSFSSAPSLGVVVVRCLALPCSPMKMFAIRFKCRTRIGFALGNALLLVLLHASFIAECVNARANSLR